LNDMPTIIFLRKKHPTTYEQQILFVFANVELLMYS